MIECKECNYKAEALSYHIRKQHNMTVKEYCQKHNGAEILSDKAVAAIQDRTARLESGKISYDISKTFGVAFENKKTVDGFSTPHQSTPAIDPHYVFQKDCLLAVLAGLEIPEERIFITGHTGSGKSSIVQQACARLNMPFIRINLDSDITRADFIGQWVLKGEKMEFVYGLLPKAFKDGYVLLLDEIDTATPSVAMVLQSILEKGGKLTIPETGEVFAPHPNFRLFATGNTKGQGDTTGMYSGTQPQNSAMMDRFTWVEIMNYPDKKIETEIVHAVSGLNKDVAKQIVKVADIVRKAFEKGDINTTMSTRTLLNIASKIKMLGDIKKAYVVSFLNRVDNADLDFCNEAVQRVWGV